MSNVSNLTKIGQNKLYSIISLDYDLASPITYVVCVNFTYEWQDLLFEVDSEK